MTPALTVVIIEDNPIVRKGLRSVLDLADGVEVVAEAADGRSGLAAVEKWRPAVTLLDHRMPLADGLDVLTHLVPLTRVLMLTSDGSEPVIRAALRGGVSGFITTGELHPFDLERAVRAVAAGQVWLSPAAAVVATADLRTASTTRLARQKWFELTRRERQLLDLLVEGLSNAEISATLVVAEKTVKNHLNHVYAKLGVSSRAQAVALWTARD